MEVFHDTVEVANQFWVSLLAGCGFVNACMHGIDGLSTVDRALSEYVCTGETRAFVLQNEPTCIRENLIITINRRQSERASYMKVARTHIEIDHE